MEDKFEKMSKWLESPEGQQAIDEWIQKESVKNEILEGRLKKLESYLQNHDFKEILDRLILEHDDSYRDKCYKKGYETYPNNKLNLLLAYVVKNGEESYHDSIPQDFLFESYFFRNYWFTIYCGQGCFYRIYDNEFNDILTI